MTLRRPADAPQAQPAPPHQRSVMQNAKHTIRHVLFRNRALRRPLVAARYRKLDPRDALLASYPRAGQTWLRFMIVEALTGEATRFGGAKAVVAPVGKHDGAPELLPGGGRLVQTHEPVCDRDRRVVYIVRDPRSIVVSEHRWQQRSGFFAGSLDDFVDLFVRGVSNPWGSWAEHVEYWRASAAARAGHLHLLRYEDLRRDTEAGLRAVLGFLGVAVPDDVVHTAIEHNSIESMRAKEDKARAEGWRRTANHEFRFIGTGAVGGWRDRLSPRQVATIEARFAPTMTWLGYLEARP